MIAGLPGAGGLRIDTGARGEELYNQMNELMKNFSDGDRLFALGLFGAQTRRWLQRERKCTQEQADMLISLALTAAEDSWRKIEARLEAITSDRTSRR